MRWKIGNLLSEDRAVVTLLAGSGVTLTANDDPAGDIEVTVAANAGGGPTGPAGGVLNGTFPNPGFSADMATQAELDAHVAAADPHTQYQRESEKNAANGYTGLDANALVAAAQLGTGSTGTNRRLLSAAQTYEQVGNFVGTWSSGTDYLLNDIVIRSGWVFVASQASGPGGVGAKDPLTQASFWDVFASGVTESYHRLIDYSSNSQEGLAVGTYLANDAQVAPYGTGNALAALASFYLDPADYVVPSSKSLVLRVRMRIFVNDTAPAASFQAGLYPFTSPIGTTGQIAGTVGAVVASSQTTVVTTPALHSTTVVVSGDFAFPAAGSYVLGVVQSGGTMAANSRIGQSVQLGWRIV